MTFRSLFIEEHENQASALEPYVTGKDYALCGSLNAYSWTASAWSFATTHNLPIDYVDNCWLRVAMDSAFLRRFLQSGSGGDSIPALLIAKIDERKWYVVNEEEF